MGKAVEKRADAFQEAHQARGSVSPLSHGSDTQQPHVLLVDDDADFVGRLYAFIGDVHPSWHVAVASSLADARAAMAARMHQPFDAVVVQHTLCDGNAFDLLDECAAASLIIGLAPGEEALAAQALRLGFADTFLRERHSRSSGTSVTAQLECLLQRRAHARLQNTMSEHLAKKRLLLAAISRAHSQFLTSPRTADAFEGLLRDLLALTESRFGFVAEVLDDPDASAGLKSRPITEITWDAESRMLVQGQAGSQWPMADDGSLFGAALRTGEPVIANHPATDARSGGLSPGHPPLLAFLGLPVRAQGKLVAMIALANRAGGYSRDMVAFLEPMAATVGQLVQARRNAVQRATDAELLRQNEARWRSLADLSSDWYWEQDADYRLVRLEGNIKHQSAAGLGNDLLGTLRWEMPVVNLTQSDWVAHRAALDARQNFRDFEMQFKGEAGDSHWVSISGMPMFDPQGGFEGYRGMGRDITAQKRAELHIEWLANVDDLTGLPNRRRLLERMTQAQDDSVQLGRYAAFMLLDLDNFHNVNDSLGMERSDEVLKLVATRLRGCVRPNDTLARLGGDQFALLQEGLARDEHTARMQAESTAIAIQQSLAEPHVAGDAELVSTASTGIVVFFDNRCTVHELLQRADLAMHQAKSAGRNTHRFFAPAMHEAVLNHQRLEADLRQALALEALTVHYQPIVENNGRMVGVEALVRWMHAVRGSVSPAEFIPVAEQSGLIVAVGQRVLTTACLQLAQWAKLLSTRSLSIAVNVSAREFQQPGFAENVLATLRRTGADPCLLKLEVTESLLMQDVPGAVAVMRRLSAVGIGWSLDDFGTGFSSLSYLKRLPVDRLKIDQSFVRGVLTDPHDAAIALALIRLAESIGLKVVAEGVETAEQHAFLESNGCTLFQGYYHGRPVRIETLVIAP